MIVNDLVNKQLTDLIVCKEWLKGFTDEMIGKIVSGWSDLGELPEISEWGMILKSSEKETVTIELKIIRHER